MSSGRRFANLLKPIRVGSLELKNRIVMAALTRQRCNYETGIPNDLNVKYYTARADAGLILTECSPISPRGNAFPGAGGIWNDEQAEGWKKVVDSVHDAGGKIFLQIWHCGRAGHSSLSNGLKVWAPSEIPIRGENLWANKPYEVPLQMHVDEIHQVKDEFKQGALRAKQAGFDGIQLHGAHGYLVDQFLRQSANKRTDKYGGSVENRSRFCLEIIDVLNDVFGNERVGIKVSPVGVLNDMFDPNALALYSYLFKELDKRKIAFIELKDDNDPPNQFEFTYPPSKSIIYDVFHSLKPYFQGVIIGNNDFDPEKAENYIRKGICDMVSFGRLFISNPDLVKRIENDLPLNYEWDHNTFYSQGIEGYLDYPDFSHEQEKLRQESKDYKNE